MRYIKKEFILTTICDYSIDSEEEYEDIFSLIKNANIDISVVLTRDNGVFKYEKSRIKSINKDLNSVDLTIYKNKSSLLLKDVKYVDFLSLEVIDKDNKLYERKDTVHRKPKIDCD